MNNKLIIAAAGSGKTTYLVDKSLELQNKKILITTFTTENETCIKEKFLEKQGYIPENIIIQSRFSFLLQYLLKPYQSELFSELFDKTIGFCFSEYISAKYSKKKGYKPLFFCKKLNI